MCFWLLDMRVKSTCSSLYVIDISLDVSDTAIH